MDDTMIRGDSKVWYYHLTDGDAVALDLTGHTLWWTLKQTADSDVADSTALVAHYIAFDGSGSVTGSEGFALGGWDTTQEPPVYTSDITDGIVTQTISATESAAIAPGEYVFDLQVMDANGIVSTIIASATLTVTADITRRITTP